MYKLNRTDRQLMKLTPTTLTDQGLLERLDLEEWISSSPEVLGEDLFVLSTEHILPTKLRIDILAVDKRANLPLPEARDYVTRREPKQQTRREAVRSSFSLEKGNFSEQELEQRLLATLRRTSDLTPRFAAFLEVLLSANRPFGREELKKALFDRGIGEDVGQAGRFISNLSQFLTKQSNPHLRQLIAFEGGSRQGQVKDRYQIVETHRGLVESVLRSWHQESAREGA